MPWCIYHPDVQVVTDCRGVLICHRCEAEKRAALDRRCRICMAPVTTPGLCPSCATTNILRERAEWLGQHALAMILLLALLGLWASWTTLLRFTCSLAFMGSGRDRCYTADPPPNCNAFAGMCTATLRDERDEAARRAAERVSAGEQARRE